MARDDANWAKPVRQLEAADVAGLAARATRPPLVIARIPRVSPARRHALRIRNTPQAAEPPLVITTQAGRKYKRMNSARQLHCLAAHLLFMMRRRLRPVTPAGRR